ncbi:PRC-barrel domain-containing protein [Streptomyces sp. NPDC057445]|uniref:PRC-barrel domain-containing protein n=1 Tax=Streptomyces sp. NPDC057445 TaxID=3346136 RepID=UPI0036CEC7E3
MGGTVQTDIDPRSLIGRKAFDRNGTKIGTVDEVYLDDATGMPEWAAVRTGLFSRDAFVPLEPSEVAGDGLHIPFERALIKDAPDFGVGRHLSPQQELQLYHHYGLELPAPPEKPAPSPPAASDGPDSSPGSTGDRDFGRLAGHDD